jgi:hypothetical protein
VDVGEAVLGNGDVERPLGVKPDLDLLAVPQVLVQVAISQERLRQTYLDETR